MALNSGEQQLFDYVQKNPEERRFWEQKVLTIAAAHEDDMTTAVALDNELRAYAIERMRVVRDLEDLPPGMSLRGLAEHLIRVWAPPRPKKKKKEADFWPRP